MSEQVERTYVCDLTGKEINDTWSMLTVQLDYGGRVGMSLHHLGDSGETIHVHPDEHDVSRGNDEPAEWDVTGYVTAEKTIPMFTIEAGHFREHINVGGGEWADLAERIQTEVLDQ